jgi:WD40 repeat protein
VKSHTVRMSRVFLSHSSRDNVEALALKAWLEQEEPGLVGEIFLDVHSEDGIPAGTQWRATLRRANDRCEAMICLLSENWDASHECRTEYRTSENLGKSIFPVRLTPLAGRHITDEWQRCDLYGDGPTTPILADGVTVKFSTAGLTRLLNDLRKAGVAPVSFPWPPDADPDRAPYRGWQPLGAVDAAVYFGRDAEMNRALTAIRVMRNSDENKAFVIRGSSGVGKSSFLRAGVLPRLQRDDRHFLVMNVIRPQQEPLYGKHGLANALHQLRTRVGLREPALGVIKNGVTGPAQVRSWLAEAQEAAVEALVDAVDTAPPTIVMPVDQAEELVGADADEEAAEFLTVIAALLDDAEPRLPILALVTVRSDRDDLLRMAPQLEGVDWQVFDDLKPMPQTQYREVICGPADQIASADARVQWDPELVDRLLQDCAASADALPLLALTLSRLYGDYRGKTIGLAEYDAMGGMQHVVDRVIAEALAAVPGELDEHLRHLRKAFIPYLSAINPLNGDPMRRTASYSDLPGRSRPLIDALVARRLLAKDDHYGVPVVEVALESLLRQWDTLAGWLAEESSNLIDADALEREATDWEHNGRPDDWLWLGTRLANARKLAAKRGYRDQLNSAREFLSASEQHDDRRTRELQESAEARAAAEEEARIAAQEHTRELLRQAHRLRKWVAVAGTVTVIAGGLAGLGWIEKRKASHESHDKTAQNLDLSSEKMLAGLYRPEGANDVDAIQLALAARDFSSDFQNDDFFLANALNRERDLIKIIDLPLPVMQAVFSPDGRRILSGDLGMQVRQWDVASGQPVTAPMSGHSGGVRSVAYNHDGTEVVSGGDDGTIRRWDARTGQPIGDPLHAQDGSVTSLAFNPAGTRFASAFADGTIRIWDAKHGTPIGGPLRGHKGVVVSVAFNPDGSRIVSASTDDTVRVWDAFNDKQIRILLEGHNDDVPSVTYTNTPEGKRIVAAFEKTIWVWDADSLAPIGAPMSSRHTGPITSLAFNSDGTRMATGSADTTIGLWDTATWPWRQAGVLTGHRGTVDSVAFNPRGPELVSAGDDNTIRVWDPVTWQPMTVPTGWVSATFNDDGRTISSGGQDPTIRTWDAASGRQTRPSMPVAADVDSLVPVGHGQLLSLNAAHEAQIWDALTGAELGRSPPTPPDVDATYDPTRRDFAIQTGPSTIDILDLRRTVLRSIRQDAQVRSCGFSPDGRLLATGGWDSYVRLWDIDTGKQIGPPLKGDGWIFDVDFSHGDGRFLIAADTASHVHVWDLKDSKAPPVTVAADATVAVLAISRDGTLLAAGDQEGRITLWEVKSGRQLGDALDGHTGAIESLEFSSDGRRLLSSSADSTLRLWPMPNMSRETLCTKITHNMTTQEWNEVVGGDIGYVTQCPGLPDSDDSG